ncbi:hypothetical protein FI667_g14535, partial [Globisporangium splendens]
MVDDHEQNLVLASAKLERAKLKYERLAKVLIGVKAGVEHLVDKLECVRDDGQVVVVTDETIIDALQESEMTLVRLLNQIKTVAAAGGSLSGQPLQQQPTEKKEGSSLVRLGTMRGAGLGSTGISLSDTAAASISDSDMLVSQPYNQRVALPGDGLTRDEMEDDAIGGGGGMVLDGPEEALSRDRVKKASTQVILAQDKKKKRVLKKRVKDNLNDSPDDEIIPGLNGSSGTGNDGNGGGNGARGVSSSPLNKMMLSPKKR